MTDQPYYINRQNKPIKLTITSHARRRFILRWSIIFPNNPLTYNNVDKEILNYFSRAERVVKLSYKDRKRLARHGKDTLFFRTSNFTFVVQNATIVTVEISDRNKRHLNKTISISNTPSLNEKKNEPVINVKQDVPELESSKKTRFRILAAANNDKGKLVFVNLGSYELPSDCLNVDELFCQEIKNRFNEKKPTWTLLSVFASKKNKYIKVIDESPLTGR